MEDLRIDADELEIEYGVNPSEYYFFDVQNDEMCPIGESGFSLYRHLRATFSYECTCLQYESEKAGFAPIADIDPLKSDSEDWSNRETSETDRIAPNSEAEEALILLLEDYSASQRLFNVMLHAHGLSHVTNTPRTGAHFIKTWAAPYSDDWYAAECFDLLSAIMRENRLDEVSSILAQMTKAYRLGRAKSDMLWRKRHFETSRSGKKQLDSLKAATRRGTDTASKRTKTKLACLQKLWLAICKEDELLRRYDTKAADTLFDFLKANSSDAAYKSLKIRKTGEPIGQDAIRRFIRELRASGKI
ncbi:hypothetical protein ROLI_005920 [Roseobacter fucihabitans]|uniref:Uncharacterized protein n=2 Tax=Roseobacter fucihabitans TaxID=1537242 RepID=A0ABZ2BNE6_9RHOB|nr:hypothetical protein [Roseobacter litoralis]